MQHGSPFYVLVFSTIVLAPLACGGVAPVDGDPQLPSVVPSADTATNAMDGASESALLADSDAPGAATDSDGFDSSAVHSDSSAADSDRFDSAAFDAAAVDSGAGVLDAGTPLDSASSDGGALSCYEVRCTSNSDCSSPCTRCNLFGRCSVL